MVGYGDENGGDVYCDGYVKRLVVMSRVMMVTETMMIVIETNQTLTKCR